jgi:hypothetical protein
VATETTTPTGATTDRERVRESICSPVIDPYVGRARLTFLDLDIVCRIDHLELVQEQAVRDRIGDFLRAGEPVAGADDDCPARGAEVQAFTLPFGARRTRAAGGPPNAMTPEQADRAGAIELLDLGAQKLFATNASTPVRLRLEGRRTGLRVTPLGADGDRGRPRLYGPLSGAITIDAGAGAKIRKAGKLVAPLRRADLRRVRFQSVDASATSSGRDGPPRTAPRVRRGLVSAAPRSTRHW